MENGERGTVIDVKRLSRKDNKLDNGVIEKLFVEEGQRDNADTDPYEFTKPENVYSYVKSTILEEELV